jgi:hypothetical protein
MKAIRLLAFSISEPLAAFSLACGGSHQEHSEDSQSQEKAW